MGVLLVTNEVFDYLASVGEFEGNEIELSLFR